PNASPPHVLIARLSHYIFVFSSCLIPSFDSPTATVYLKTSLLIQPPGTLTNTPHVLLQYAYLQILRTRTFSSLAYRITSSSFPLVLYHHSILQRRQYT